MTGRAAFNRGPSWWLRCGLVVLAMASLVRAQSADEHQIKAVFLFNFAQFVEWPSTAFADPQAPLIVGVLGADPFGAYLDDAVAGEVVNGRPFLVRRYRRVEEVEACHLLFISRSEAPRLERIFAWLRKRPILTVGDSEGFATRGGIIRFISERNKIRFRINLAAARAAHLVISSKVLRSAEVLEPENPGL